MCYSIYFNEFYSNWALNLLLSAIINFDNLSILLKQIYRHSLGKSNSNMNVHTLIQVLLIIVRLSFSIFNQLANLRFW